MGRQFYPRPLGSLGSTVSVRPSHATIPYDTTGYKMKSIHSLVYGTLPKQKINKQRN